MIENISQQVGTYLPGILTAIAVLLIGWIAAHLIARIVRLGLKKSGLDAKLKNWISPNGALDVGKIVGKVVFYLIMVFVAITFFNVLNLPVVSQPLNAFLEQIFSYAPRIISAAVLGIIAYVLARVVKEVAKGGLEAIKIDERIANFGQDANAVVSSVKSVVDDGLQLDEQLDEDEDGAMFSDFGDEAQPSEAIAPSVSVGDGEVKLSSTIPEALYWVVFALFLPAILGALQMPGILDPVQKMFTKAMSFVPNILGAIIVLVIGAFVAKIVRQVASNLTASLGVNSVASRFGLGQMSNDRKVSDILGVVCYAAVLMPVIVASLGILDIEAVSDPATKVLGKITSVFPGLLGAAIVLGIAYFVAKIVSGLVEDLLSGVGFDGVPEKIGLRLSNTNPDASPSKLGGKLTMVAIMLLSVMQALPMMGLEGLSTHVETFAGFATNVLVGLLIIGLGLYLANLAASLIKDSGIENAGKLGFVARIAIIVFAGGFGVQQMGLSASIVNVAFASMLGGAGLAMAIAFGWGGRDAAKRVLDRYVK